VSEKLDLTDWSDWIVEHNDLGIARFESSRRIIMAFFERVAAVMAEMKGSTEANTEKF
jgi:hypothetical protein